MCLVEIRPTIYTDGMGRTVLHKIEPSEAFDKLPARAVPVVGYDSSTPSPATNPCEIARRGSPVVARKSKRLRRFRLSL